MDLKEHETFKLQHEKTGLSGYLTRSDIDQRVKLQEMARRLEFGILEGFYYPCSDS